MILPWTGPQEHCTEANSLSSVEFPLGSGVVSSASSGRRDAEAALGTSRSAKGDSAVCRREVPVRGFCPKALTHNRERSAHTTRTSHERTSIHV